jgi:hypothetical protein
MNDREAIFDYLGSSVVQISGVKEVVVLISLDKHDRKLAPRNEVGFPAPRHLRARGAHPGLHPGTFSAVPPGLDRFC